MATERRWKITEDGYHKRIRFVDVKTGKILGEVSGTNHDSKGEWGASIRGAKEPHVGSYVTEGQAKKAVERALDGKEAKNGEQDSVAECVPNVCWDGPSKRTRC